MGYHEVCLLKNNERLISDSWPVFALRMNGQRSILRGLQHVGEGKNSTELRYSERLPLFVAKRLVRSVLHAESLTRPNSVFTTLTQQPNYSTWVATVDVLRPAYLKRLLSAYFFVEPVTRDTTKLSKCAKIEVASNYTRSDCLRPYNCWFCAYWAVWHGLCIIIPCRLLLLRGKDAPCNYFLCNAVPCEVW